MTEGTTCSRLEDMFNAHHELVWRTLRRRGLTPETAADATQQTFLIALERLADIRLGSERAFLIATALHLARTSLRKAARCQFEGNMDALGGPSVHAEDGVDQRRAVLLMNRLLAQLAPELNEVFVLFELEGFTTPEIAELIKVPLGTAASRLRRARQQFRTLALRLDEESGLRCGNG